MLGMDPHRLEPEWTDDLRGRFDELLDVYRRALRASLESLTEDEVRTRLVPSRTTLLGLLKHVTYVEGVWFDQAVNGGTTGEVGIPSSPDRSFVLTATDSIASVLAEHEHRCDRSRTTLAGLHLSDVVQGRGERTVWALYLQVLRELAQHAGHADILREQILAARTG
jgi:hypothetical protein